MYIIISSGILVFSIITAKVIRNCCKQIKVDKAFAGGTTGGCGNLACAEEGGIGAGVTEATCPRRASILSPPPDYIQYLPTQPLNRTVGFDSGNATVQRNCAAAILRGPGYKNMEYMDFVPSTLPDIQEQNYLENQYANNPSPAQYQQPGNGYVNDNRNHPMTANQINRESGSRFNANNVPLNVYNVQRITPASYFGQTKSPFKTKNNYVTKSNGDAYSCQERDQLKRAYPNNPRHFGVYRRGAINKTGFPRRPQTNSKGERIIYSHGLYNRGPKSQMPRRNSLDTQARTFYNNYGSYGQYQSIDSIQLRQLYGNIMEYGHEYDTYNSQHGMLSNLNKSFDIDLEGAYHYQNTSHSYPAGMPGFHHNQPNGNIFHSGHNHPMEKLHQNQQYPNMQHHPSFKHLTNHDPRRQQYINNNRYNSNAIQATYVVRSPHKSLYHEKELNTDTPNKPYSNELTNQSDLNNKKSNMSLNEKNNVKEVPLKSNCPEVNDNEGHESDNKRQNRPNKEHDTQSIKSFESCKTDLKIHDKVKSKSKTNLKTEQVIPIVSAQRSLPFSLVDIIKAKANLQSLNNSEKEIAKP